MLTTLKNAWKVPDLRKKILYTLLLIFIYRLGSHVPVPGINRAALQQLFTGNGNALFGVFDIFSGGAFKNASILALSVSPYITASIIVQLLTVAIPSLERMQKEGGEDARKKLGQYTRYGTVVLAFIQATATYFGILRGAMEKDNILSYITVVFAMTAGTAFIMWLGEQITGRGIGNGISLLIYANIISQLPQGIVTLFKSELNPVIVILVLAAAVLIVAGVTTIYKAERRIPVQYAKRVSGRQVYGGQTTHIPIRVSLSGVMPIIFASSIVTFPSIIAQLLGTQVGPNAATLGGKILHYLGLQSWGGAILFALLIVFFTYFYTAIIFNPIEVANNMKKNGGFIPGIRPGKPTVDYVQTVLSKVTLLGSVFLALVALMPIIIGFVIPNFKNFQFGGTSLLIVIGVALDSAQQIKSQMVTRNYKGFLS